MIEKTLIHDAFDALRDPSSDRPKANRGFCLTTAKVNGGPERYVIAALEGKLMIPLFYALLPGEQVEVLGQKGRTVDISDFSKGTKR